MTHQRYGGWPTMRHGCCTSWRCIEVSAVLRARIGNLPFVGRVRERRCGRSCDRRSRGPSRTLTAKHRRVVRRQDRDIAASVGPDVGQPSYKDVVGIHGKRQQHDLRGHRDVDDVPRSHECVVVTDHERGAEDSGTFPRVRRANHQSERDALWVCWHRHSESIKRPVPSGRRFAFQRARTRADIEAAYRALAALQRGRRIPRGPSPASSSSRTLLAKGSRRSTRSLSS